MKPKFAAAGPGLMRSADRLFEDSEPLSKSLIDSAFFIDRDTSERTDRESSSSSFVIVGKTC